MTYIPLEIPKHDIGPSYPPLIGLLIPFTRAWHKCETDHHDSEQTDDDRVENEGSILLTDKSGKEWSCTRSRVSCLVCNGDGCLIQDMRKNPPSRLELL